VIVVVLLLLFLLATAIAAACNVMSALLGLGIIPAFPGSHLFFAVKNYYADLLLWLVLGAGLTIVAAIWRDRRNVWREPAPRRRPLAEDGSVVVVLTAYDDDASIGDAVRDFARQPRVRDVIVVDNNSTDATSFVARQAGARIVYERRQGYGFACMRGLRAALELEPEAVVLSEGDGTFAGRDVGRLLDYLDDADMVVGNRITPGFVDRESQMDSFFVWGNQIGAKLIQLKFWEWRFLGRARQSDLGCTMRAVRADALAAIIDDLSVGGNHFSPHMLMAALRRRLLLVEVPVTFRPRVGVSKGASESLRKGVLIGLAMLWHIVAFPNRSMPAYEPQRVSPSSQEERAA